MPNKDGTGPRGEGPMTGRLGGLCVGCGNKRYSFGRQRVFRNRCLQPTDDNVCLECLKLQKEQLEEDIRVLEESMKDDNKPNKK